MSLELPDRWTSEPREHDLFFAREDDELTVEFVVKVPADAANEPYAITNVT